MLIDVVRPENWDELNERVHKILNLQPKEQLRCYKGLGAATFEIARGTAQFLTHKKALGFILGQTPVFEPLLPNFYKETFEITTALHTEVTDLNAWVEQLKRETNFVIFSEDHPVTGELYPFADKLDELLNAKRIFSFRISHHSHFFEKINIRPYTVRLCSFAAEVAVAICGERFRSPPLVVREESWDAEDFCDRLNASQGKKIQAQEDILKFEADVSTWAEPFFKLSSNRVWDRSVISFQDASAEAVAQTFFKKFGGEKWVYLETPNMCRWNTTGLFQKWWVPKISLESLRGLLIIDPYLLRNKDFAKQLQSAYEEVKAQQSWEV